MAKKWKILITNDDGIAAPGILELARLALQLGDVWIAAPEGQCSAMSQRMTCRGALTAAPHALDVPVEAAWSISGTPVDCVKTALTALLPVRPDVVLSGINNGYNMGYDIAYSGTVGAACEALMQGIPAIACSASDDHSYGAVEESFLPLMQELLAQQPGTGALWNVNFPPEAKGILRGCRPAGFSFYHNRYTVQPQTDGATRLEIQMNLPDPARCEPGTDICAVLSGYISVGTIRSMVL